jgi:hypothetical protein
MERQTRWGMKSGIRGLKTALEMDIGARTIGLRDGKGRKRKKVVEIPAYSCSPFVSHQISHAFSHNIRISSLSPSRVKTYRQCAMILIHLPSLFAFQNPINKLRPLSFCLITAHSGTIAVVVVVCVYIGRALQDPIYPRRPRAVAMATSPTATIPIFIPGQYHIIGTIVGNGVSNFIVIAPDVRQ